MAKKNEAKPLAEPQSPGAPQRAQDAKGTKLSEVDQAELTKNPTPVFGDESKPLYVGSENAPEPFEPEISVVESGLSGTTPEVHVIMDQVVPGEVYIPDEGRGDLTLPLHGFAGAKTPQQVFDEVENADISDEDREAAASEGRTAQDLANDRKNDS